MLSDASKTDDDLAEALLSMPDTCSLDVADSREALPPSKVAGLVSLTGARVDQITRAAGPKIKKGLEDAGYSFDLLFNDDPEHRKSEPVKQGPKPKRVNPPRFEMPVRERAVAIYHRRCRADAVAFVELATGREVKGSLIRDWAKKSDKKKRESGPWAKVRYPLSTVRKALTLYRAEVAGGLATRAAAAKTSRVLGVALSYSTLIKWDKIAKEHGTP